MNNKEWYLGLDNFRKCTFIPGESQNEFITEILEHDFEPNRDLEVIILDHFASIQSKKKEILFSGGVDSEYILRICKKHNIDVEVVIMRINVQGFMYNTHDLYYAQKFVVDNDIKHRFVDLDANEFFRSGRYLDYLIPYNIEEPHVAAHFWLIEQCHYFPIFGGDWPWVHTHKDKMTISPSRLSYNCYEQFMKSRNIEGIGNFLGYSFESTYKLIQLHIETSQKILNEKTYELIPPRIKQFMFDMKYPRIRSHGFTGWPGINNAFPVGKFKDILAQYVKPSTQKIVWGDKLKELLKADVNEHDTFE
jgi:hypothetical protein